MLRSRFKHVSALACLLLAALVASERHASGQTISNREATLEERLVAGLQARRPSEFAFLDAVLDTVNRGDISEKFVDRFFNWARSKSAKRGGRHRAIIYFQAGLLRAAEKLDITIEADPPPSSGG